VCDTGNMVSQRSLWTIGHSTRAIDEFLELLHAHEIQLLVDIRTVPRSRRHPQFDTAALTRTLEKAGVAYLHMPSLGGLRKPRKDSINTGWRNPSFRGYADYMQTKEFWKAVEDLIARAAIAPSAIMCAEAVPWRCHRSLVADALLSRGWDVRHITSRAEPSAHKLTPFAVIENGGLIYPQPANSIGGSRLFPPGS